MQAVSLSPWADRGHSGRWSLVWTAQRRGLSEIGHHRRLPHSWTKQSSPACRRVPPRWHRRWPRPHHRCKGGTAWDCLVPTRADRAWRPIAPAPRNVDPLASYVERLTIAARGWEPPCDCGLDRRVCASPAGLGSAPTGARAGPFRAVCRGSAGIVTADLVLTGWWLKSDPLRLDCPLKAGFIAGLMNS